MGLAEIGSLEDSGDAGRVLNEALDVGIYFLDTAECCGAQRGVPRDKHLLPQVRVGAGDQGGARTRPRSVRWRAVDRRNGDRHDRA